MAWLSPVFPSTVNGCDGLKDCRARYLVSLPLAVSAAHPGGGTLHAERLFGLEKSWCPMRGCISCNSYL
jgi:hypothetical protein